MAIKVFEGLEFLNESLVLIFEHSHPVFKTFDILLLLPATLPGSLPGTNTRQMTTGTATARQQPGYIREPGAIETPQWAERVLRVKRTTDLDTDSGHAGPRTMHTFDEGQCRCSEKRYCNTDKLHLLPSDVKQTVANSKYLQEKNRTAWPNPTTVNFGTISCLLLKSVAVGKQQGFSGILKV